MLLPSESESCFPSFFGSVPVCLRCVSQDEDTLELKFRGSNAKADKLVAAYALALLRPLHYESDDGVQAGIAQLQAFAEERVVLHLEHLIVSMVHQLTVFSVVTVHACAVSIATRFNPCPCSCVCRRRRSFSKSSFGPRTLPHTRLRRCTSCRNGVRSWRASSCCS